MAKRMLVAVGLFVAMACGRDTDPSRAGDGEPSGVAVWVDLTGCIGIPPGTAGYALERVQFPTAEAALSAAQVAGITEDAWVRLEGDKDALAALIGEHVRIRGAVIDSGRNTIGTAGVSGYETPSGDKSQAASDQHYAVKQQKEAGRIARQSMANGRAAEIRVTSIEVIDPARCKDQPPGRM